MLPQILDRPRLVVDGRSKNVDELGEDFLGYSLPHVVSELLIYHEEHESSDAHDLNDWVLVAGVKLVHDNISHDFDRLPELLLIVKQLLQLLEEIFHGYLVDREGLVLLSKLLSRGKRGTSFFAELFGLDNSWSLYFLLLHLLVHLKSANLALHCDFLLIESAGLDATVTIVWTVVCIHSLVLERAAESWTVLNQPRQNV